MICIPIATLDHKNDLVIVIVNKGNLDRMAKSDPCEIKLKRVGYDLVNPTILFCHEEDDPELTRLLHMKDLPGIYDYVMRGWTVREDLGDGQPYRSLSEDG
jgi:hypothetical protein